MSAFIVVFLTLATPTLFVLQLASECRDAAEARKAHGAR
jgi:hypothetical protein